MLKQESNGGRSCGCATGINNWARVCDSCRAAPCKLYCKADSAYLCASCDARVHSANCVASRNERVWVCEACERAPAALLCKADAASLCTSCDAEIHSVNQLARRHQRVPALAISGCPYGPQVMPARGGGEAIDDMIMTQDGENGIREEEEEDDDEEEEAASWLLTNPAKDNGNNYQNHNSDNRFLFGGEYLDLIEQNSNSCGENQYYDNHHRRHNTCLHQKSACGGGDSVVPVQCRDNAAENQIHQRQHNFFLHSELESPKAAYSYSGSSYHSASISSIEVGVVPEDSKMSKAFISHSRPAKGTIDLFITAAAAPQMPSQLSPTERKARVMRYKEKKKTRKFEKTIRYASRKAYAETRPRIKGRFVKRSHAEAEAGQMLLMPETGYGVIPSF